jgi:hypothetical protein
MDTTMECNFCGEMGHSIMECNHDDLYSAWEQLVCMMRHHSQWDEQAFTFQKRFLQHDVPHNVVIAIAVRFCNLESPYTATFDDIMLSIYRELNVLYSDMANEEEISEMLNESIDIIDPEAEEAEEAETEAEEHFKWRVEPFLLCLETEHELKEEVFCSICLDNHTKLDTVTTNCGHEFGKACMCSHLDYHLVSRCPTCPMCRTEVTTLEIKDVDFYDELYERYVNAPLETALENMSNALDSSSEVAFLDSFEFMPQSVF